MRVLESSDHQTYQHYFAGIDGEAVLALRHLFSCPVCARVSRLLLCGFRAPPGSPPTGRSAPADAGKAPQEGA
jgi:hypothetical protein